MQTTRIELTHELLNEVGRQQTVFQAMQDPRFQLLAGNAPRILAPTLLPTGRTVVHTLARAVR